MKGFLSTKFIRYIFLVVCLLTNAINEVKNESRTRRTKATTTTEFTLLDDMKDIEKPRPGKAGDGEYYMPMRQVVELKDLEEAYISHFANCTKNGTNLWPEAKKMEGQKKLAAMCTRAHFLHGCDYMYDVVEQAKVQDGVLQFVKKANKKYSPVRINVVKYKSNHEDKYRYLTKGLKNTCVFYVQPLNNSETDYFLTKYVQEVPMPAL